MCAPLFITGVVLVKVLISVERYHDHVNFYKEKYLIKATCLQFQRFSKLSSWQGACGVPAEVVLELRVLHFNSEATGSQLTYWAVS